MRIIRDAGAMQKLCRAFGRKGLSIGLVPTMGALHEGHLSLIRASRRENGITCVSVFVNPIQFGPREDFRSYPRPVRLDTALCRKEKVDVLFLPSAGRLFPSGFKTYVEVESISGILCGASRKGHFRGVATVVAKLFNIVQPGRAYFGQKDYQQTVVLRRMVRDLDFPVRVRVMPIVRDHDGLALSSRNAYLSAAERRSASALYSSLRAAAGMAVSGERDPRELIGEVRKRIRGQGNIKLEYVTVSAAESLEPVSRVEGRVVIALAARVGRTRLIDNVLVKT